MKRRNTKSSFIIVRVTPSEKGYLKKQSKSFSGSFSDFIRKLLGLEK